MDIAALLESHRNNLLDDLNGRLEGHPNLSPYQIVEICYDRATIKSLLATLANGEVKPLGQAAPTTPPTTPSKRVKAGSKAARQRALKAGETRRNNLAQKRAAEANAGSFKGAATVNDPSAPRVDGVKLAAGTEEGGAA